MRFASLPPSWSVCRSLGHAIGASDISVSIHTQVSHPCSSHRAPIHHLSPLSDPFSFVVIVLVIVVVDLLLLVPISSHASQPPHRNSKPPALRSFRSSKLLQAIGLLCIGKRQVVRIAIAIAIAHPILITSGLAVHSRLFRPLRRFVIGTTATGPLPDHLCESMCPLPPLHSRQTVLCSALLVSQRSLLIIYHIAHPSTNCCRLPPDRRLDRVICCRQACSPPLTSEPMP